MRNIYANALKVLATDFAGHRGPSPISTGSYMLRTDRYASFLAGLTMNSLPLTDFGLSLSRQTPCRTLTRSGRAASCGDPSSETFS